MRRWRIRTRLVIATSVVAGVLLGVALIVARAEVSNLLHTSAVDLAQSDLAPFVTDLQRNPDETPDAPTHGELVVIRDAHGTDLLDTAPHDVRGVLPRQADANGQRDFSDDEGRTYVIVSTVVTNRNGTWSLWAARDISTNVTSISGIDLVFALMGLGLLAVMSIASWLAVTRALRPVEDMRRHAKTLGPDELLPVGDNDDELARLAETLNELVVNVRHAASRERQMVSDAAHELRTPLAGLRAEIELAARHLDKPELTAERLDSARIAAERLSDLATNLLELSRIDEGTERDSRTSGARIAAELLAATDRARNLAAHTDIEIDDIITITDPGAKYAVSELAVSRLIDNLCSNARRALGSAGTITIEARDDGPLIILSVHDDGPGAPDDFLPHAFERFSRSQTSRTGEGSGLGLSLVEAIAMNGHGTAHVSNTHPGFRAEVRLPKM